MKISIYLILFITLFQKYSLNSFEKVSNISQCFTQINETTLEKKSFYYEDSKIKEQCTKLALSQKYKEDIFYPKYFHKCFPLCNSCSEFSQNKNNMKCHSCLNGFILDKEKGNCYINKKYDSKKRNQELNKIFNTLNINPKIDSNFLKKKYIDGREFLISDPPPVNLNLRKLYYLDDLDDFSNAIMDREIQSSLTNDKNEIAYNFRIELSPYYYLAKRCASKGKYFIEKGRCADKCTPHLEYYHGYPEIIISIPIGPNDDDVVKVCDCEFRCCIKKQNELYKSLDRGFIDGSYNYFRRHTDGRCLAFKSSYTERSSNEAYILAQDFVPCFFPIYDDNDEVEFLISGYQKTVIGNNCTSLCPVDDSEQYYYYNPENSGCYKCPEHCLECDGIPTPEHGHCVKCERFYDAVVNGFCTILCPEGYGEKNGIDYICEKCDDDEIIFDNQCVKYQGPDYNYGTVDNPSYPDSSDPKKIHRCMEYISFMKYVFNSDTSICPYIECPVGFYNGDNEVCVECGQGCAECKKTQNGIICLKCKEKFELDNGHCTPCDYILNRMGSNSCLQTCDIFTYRQGGKTYCSYDCSTYYYTDTTTCREICNGDDLSLPSDHLCLDTCNMEYPENLDGHCISCPLEGLYNANGTCVKKDENFDELYYKIPGEENVTYGHLGNCYIIDELGDYHPEHTISRQYNSSFCPDDCPSNFIKLYDENGDVFCRKCYEACKSCNYTGSPGNHKCLECKEGYEPSQRMYQVCDQICKDGQFFYFEDTREKKCGDVCPDEKPYILVPDTDDVKNFECIANCTINGQLSLENSFYCIRECPQGYAYMYSECREKCPEDYGPFGENNECKNCTENKLFYYEYKCYNYTIELPEGKYFEPDPIKPLGGELKNCLDDVKISGSLLITGYFEQYNNCSVPCPEGYYVSNELSGCLQCEYDSGNCLYCDPLSGCSNECPDNYIYYFDFDSFSEACLKNCPDEKPYYNFAECTDNCLGEKIVTEENDGITRKYCENIQCKEIDTYYHSETNTCYKATQIPEDTYYNDENQPTSDENNLSPCFTEISSAEYHTGFFYTISNCIIPCKEGYFYAGNNICKKCHPLCKTCFAEGTNSENNCFTCADNENRILNPYLYNCEKKCEGSFHYDEDTKKIICDTKCEKGNYIDENTGDCMTTCNKLIDGNYCVDECPSDKTEFNGYCLKNVTIPVIIIKDNDTIINTNTNSNNNDDNNQNNNDYYNNFENKDIIEIIKIIERNISEYFYSYQNNNYTTFENDENNNNYKTIISKDGNITLIELNLNMSENSQIFPNSSLFLYFSEVISQRLKQIYPTESSFYIIQIDLNEKNSEKNNINFFPQTKYKIYLKSGEEILLNESDSNMYIIIQKDYYYLNKLQNNPELALYLIQKGINIFDINDPFFNDMCYKYQDENGNDVILKNRKEDYYQNVIACIPGCDFIGINSTNNKFLCKCRLKTLLLNESNLYDYLNYNYINNDVINNDEKNFGNFEVMKCFKETFNKKEIIKNKGLWVYLGFLIGLILLYICYLCYDFDPLYSFLNNFSKNEKISKNEIIEEETITKKEIINNFKKEKKISGDVISENKENPPKRDLERKISKEEKESNNIKSNLTQDVIEPRMKKNYRINFEKNEKKYPKLSISNFGKEGFKLSNKFDKIDLNNLSSENNLETISSQDYQEFDYSSPRSLSSNASPISPNSPSSESSFYDEKKFSGREVDLEPEGALLEKNNFFDTCRIVKLPQDFNNSKNMQNIQNKSNILSLNNKLKNSFYKKKKKTVKLPGFPRPHIEEENENPINRQKNLENISENKSDDSSDLSSEKSDNEKNIRKEIYNINKELIEKESNINIDTNKDIYHKYKKNFMNKNRYPFRNSRSLRNSTASETFTQQPITINKYYITNNTPEEMLNQKERLKNNYLANKNKTDEKGEKIITIKKRKLTSNYKNIFSEYLCKYDLDSADFEYFITYEKRNFCDIYYSFLSNFQSFLNIFLQNTKNIFVPFSIRGGIFLFKVELYFTGIALFTSFSKLEKRYKFNKPVDIIYLIQNEYTVIIYASLLAKIMNLITWYFLMHHSITKIIKEYSFKENIFLEKIQKEIFWLKCKYHTFFIICFILTILQGYYISCFCGIFQGAIKPWIFSALITIGINFGLSFFIILIATILRKIALRCQSYIIFFISKFILLFS